MKLSNATQGKEYFISKIETQDEEIKTFLFTLGCYENEPITIISKKKNGIVIAIKEARYNIDLGIADLILV